MSSIVEKWINLPTWPKLVVPVGVVAGAAILAGIDPKVVVGLIVTTVWLRLVEAAARQRPMLALRLASGEDTIRKTLPPLAFDAEAIVEAEVLEAKQLRDAGLRTPNLTASPALPGLNFSIRTIQSPGIARHDARLEEFSQELAEWLDDYARAADARHRTFHVPLTIANKARSAVAENVRVIVKLGEDARFVDRPAVMERPPAAPPFQPDVFGDRFKNFGSPEITMLNRSQLPFVTSGQEWKISRDARTATFDVSRVHGGEFAELDLDLYVQVRHPSEQKIDWIVSSASGAGRREGEIKLVCPAPKSARPITRLAGILHYPDVRLRGEGKDPAQPARTESPPSSVEIPEGADFRDQLRARGRIKRLESLGIPPANLSEQSSDFVAVYDAGASSEASSSSSE